MIRLKLTLDLDCVVTSATCDFIFNIHAAHTERQHVVEETLQLSQPVPTQLEIDPATLNRCLRVSAMAGPLTLSYQATIELAHHIAEPGPIAEVPVSRLPAQVLSSIYPSRYCQSDLLHRLAMREFGSRWQG